MESLRLLLLRHAKSSWDNPGLKDFDRPLSGRGQRAAPRMGAYMRTEGLEPDRVLCSPALRTRQTWELVADQLGFEPPTEYQPELYHAAPTGMLRLLQSQDHTVTTVLLIAHNPGTEDLAMRLCGSGDADALNRLGYKYPTAGLAEIRFGCRRWSEVDWQQGELVRFVIPRDLE